jgi:hypothetical protein
MHACLFLQSAKPTLLLATINAVFFGEKKLQQQFFFLRENNNLFCQDNEQAMEWDVCAPGSRGPKSKKSKKANLDLGFRLAELIL